MDEKDIEVFDKCWQYGKTPNGRVKFYIRLNSFDGKRWLQCSIPIDFNKCPYPVIKFLHDSLINLATNRDRLDLLALMLCHEIAQISEYKALFNSTDYCDSYYSVLARIQRAEERSKIFTVSDFGVLTPYSIYSNKILFDYIIQQKNNEDKNGLHFEISRSKFERLITLSNSISLQEGYVEVFSKSNIQYKHSIFDNCVEVYYMEKMDSKELIFLFYTSLY